MNGRHAAAITLLGWYLMSPPPRSDGKGGISGDPDTSASLKSWSIERSFDRANACEESLDKWQAERTAEIESLPEAERKNALSDPKRKFYFDGPFNAHCIATDDPRLAK
jgi:hypothetical protein